MAALARSHDAGRLIGGQTPPLLAYMKGKSGVGGKEGGGVGKISQ